MDDTRTLIEVTSSTGIGAFTATLIDGEWPVEIVTRLRLRGLEGLEIGYGDITIQTGISSTSSPDPALMVMTTNPDGSTDRTYPSADQYHPGIRRGSDEKGQYFDIALPRHFFQSEQPTFSIGWIDFYR